MSSQMVSPPREEDFNNDLEESDEKMDMSLDEVIKLNRDTMMQSPVRNSNRNERTPGDAREAIRRSAASRSAAMRQGKFAEARNRNGNGYFAVNRPIPPPAARSRGWIRNRNDPPRRNGPPRRPLVPGEKVHIYEGAAGKLKISVVNDNVKAPIQRPPPPNRPRINWGNDYRGRDVDDDDDFDYGGRMEMQLPPKMEDHGPPRRHRTLDSLFASIKEQREFGRPVQPFQPRFRAQSLRRRP